jgi:hypothetical protein
MRTSAALKTVSGDKAATTVKTPDSTLRDDTAMTSFLISFDDDNLSISSEFPFKINYVPQQGPTYDILQDVHHSDNELIDNFSRYLWNRFARPIKRNLN